MNNFIHLILIILSSPGRLVSCASPLQTILNMIQRRFDLVLGFQGGASLIPDPLYFWAERVRWKAIGPGKH